jgi:hypothetical protein
MISLFIYISKLLSYITFLEAKCLSILMKNLESELQKW